MRYIRYTIKVNMAMENYGLAAEYVKLLLKYAKSNTDKLKRELNECVENNNSNACAPELKGSAKPGAPYHELLEHVEYSQQLSKESDDGIGESRDLAILGLSRWSVDMFAESEVALRESLEILEVNPATDDRKNSNMVSLALVYATQHKNAEAEQALQKADVGIKVSKV
jgi:hypothetical protein